MRGDHDLLFSNEMELGFLWDQILSRAKLEIKIFYNLSMVYRAIVSILLNFRRINKYPTEEKYKTRILNLGDAS